ncbi:MAG: HD domain-containing protein [Candidatus Ozemobacteraceae bacterium]
MKKVMKKAMKEVQEELSTGLRVPSNTVSPKTSDSPGKSTSAKDGKRVHSNRPTKEKVGRKDVNTLDLKRLESVFHDYLNLKKLRRTGWQLRGIRDGESLADHCFGTALLTFLLVPAVGNLDRDRAVRLALVHELGECRVGDIPFPALAYLKGKSDAERAAVADIVAPLGPEQEEYNTLFAEFEDGSSREARFVRAIDKLEMLVTALEYEKAGFRGLGDFWTNEATFRAFSEFSELVKLGEQLRERHCELAGGFPPTMPLP